MIDADLDKLNDLLTDDLTYAHTTGWTETKTGYLETIKSGRINYISFVPKDVEIRIYGETAVLTGKVDVNLGRTDFINFRFCSIFNYVLFISFVHSYENFIIFNIPTNILY